MHHDSCGILLMNDPRKGKYFLIWFLGSFLYFVVSLELIFFLCIIEIFFFDLIKIFKNFLPDFFSFPNAFLSHSDSVM